jgi:hypothetical protein
MHSIVGAQNTNGKTTQYSNIQTQEMFSGEISFGNPRPNWNDNINLILEKWIVCVRFHRLTLEAKCRFITTNTLAVVTDGSVSIITKARKWTLSWNSFYDYHPHKLFPKDSSPSSSFKNFYPKFLYEICVLPSWRQVFMRPPRFRC